MSNCRRQPTTSSHMLEKYFENLGLSNTSCKIYEYLISHGSSLPSKISKDEKISRTTVYDQLRVLEDKGLVFHDKSNEKLKYKAEHPRHLLQIFDFELAKKTAHRKKLEQVIQGLKPQEKINEPQLRFFSGKEGVEQILSDMLLTASNIETQSMWPIKETVSILGKNYFEELNRKRIRQNISVQAIWPKKQALSLKEYPCFGTGKKHLRELKIAPENITWEIGLWLYGDKAAFISSKQELFGFVIRSQALVNFLRVFFYEMWTISKPVQPQPQYTDAFLKTV